MAGSSISPAERASSAINAMSFSELPAVQGDECCIDPTVRFGADCRLGESVAIEPYAIIHDRTTLGDGCRIGSHAVIGRQAAGFQPEWREAPEGVCTIGPGADIGPGALIDGLPGGC